MSESHNIEYKRLWKDDYIKWICGFANAKGGQIFIGKEDDGTVVGITDAKRLMEEIPNKVRTTLGIMVDVNLHYHNNLEYLEIVVENYPYPVNYKGQYHYRSGATKQELKGAALDKFLLQKKGKRWDGVPVPKVTIADLKQDSIDFFRKRAIKSLRMNEEVLSDSTEHLLDNLQLIENGFLKRAAILLFHPNPEKFITAAYIKIGFFETDDDLKYHDEVHGNLFEQIETTIDLLFTKYIKAEISYEGIHRIETYEYPKEAFREALLNAVSHKDYSGGTPIQISVYKDKIMIWNEGQLPENWTVETLLAKHPSKPYNPDIATALFRGGYIESWGRGTLKMLKECEAVGMPKPKYFYDMSGFWIQFDKELYTEASLLDLGLNERQIKAVLFVMNNKKITNGNYQELNDCSRNTASNDIAALIEKNILKSSGIKGAGAYYTLL